MERTPPAMSDDMDVSGVVYHDDESGCGPRASVPAVGESSSGLAAHVERIDVRLRTTSGRARLQPGRTPAPIGSGVVLRSGRGSFLAGEKFRKN